MLLRRFQKSSCFQSNNMMSFGRRTREKAPSNASASFWTMFNAPVVATSIEDNKKASNNGYQIALLEYASMQTMPSDFSKANALPESFMLHILTGISSYFCTDRSELQASLNAASALLKVNHAAASSSSSSLSSLSHQQERDHYDALHALVNGKLRVALNTYENIVADSPLDLLALRTAQDIYILLGEGSRSVSLTARVFPYWDSSMPGYGQVLAMHAFGLHESGDSAKAIEMADNAVSMQSKNGWAYKTLAQVYLTQGIHNIGASVLKQHRYAWEELTLMTSHLYFHAALFLFEQGRYDQMETYLTRFILPEEPLDASACTTVGQGHRLQPLLDASQLVWHLHFVDPKRASPLFDALSEAWEDLSPAFWLSPYAHLMKQSVVGMTRPLNAGSQDSYDLTQLHTMHEGKHVLPSKPRLQSSVSPDHHREVKRLYQSLLSAWTAYHQGQYSHVVHVLLPLRHSLHLIGCTRADTDVFELLLMTSCRFAGYYSTAETLLNERLSVKPNSGQTWQAFAELMHVMQNVTARDEAAAMALNLGLGQGGHGAA